MDAKNTKKEKEITVVQDTGVFNHETGDKYDGYFEAKKKDKSVRMHGPGTYTTNEGDIYTGTWDADRLGYNGEEVTVTYHGGAKYEGIMKDYNYSGTGKYTYPDASVLDCDFVESCPVGNLALTDPNGHVWLGKADQGFAWFEPVNHYYDILDTVIEKAEIRRRRRELHPGPPQPVNKPPAPKKSSSTLPNIRKTSDPKKKVLIKN